MPCLASRSFASLMSVLISDLFMGWPRGRGQTKLGGPQAVAKPTRQALAAAGPMIPALRHLCGEMRAIATTASWRATQAIRPSKAALVNP